MNSPILNAQNIDFHYGAKPVLRNISVTLDQGQFVSIIGPNGSGKTTLLNVLTGSLKQSGGDVLFQREPLGSYSVEQLARIFAVISQGASIKFPFTGLEVVMMGRHPHSRRMQGNTEADMKIVHRAMSMTDTLGFAETPVTEISGGEFQRVLFARALAQQPKIFFLDEAFSGMDVSHHIRSLNLLKKLVREEGLTVVAIMHDLNLAYLFSDKVLVLKKGENRGYAPPKALLTESFVKDVFHVTIQQIEGKGIIVIP